MKRVSIILFLLINLVVTFGCSSKEEYSQIYEGEGEHWKVEFRFPANVRDSIPKDIQPYHYVASYKHDIDDLSIYDEISMGFLWLHKDAEIISNNSLEPLSTLILSYESGAAKQTIRYVGDEEEPTRLFELSVEDKVVWDDSKDNEKYETGFIIRKEELKNMSSKIQFAVKWGDNFEVIDIIRKD